MLDPVKLLLVGVVALVVLGPDKVPGAARKASALLHDLQRYRAQLQQEVEKTVGDLPFHDELREAGRALSRVRSVTSPGRALFAAATTPVRPEPDSPDQSPPAAQDPAGAPDQSPPAAQDPAGAPDQSPPAAQDPAGAPDRAPPAAQDPAGAPDPAAAGPARPAARLAEPPPFDPSSN